MKVLDTSLRTAVLLMAHPDCHNMAIEKQFRKLREDLSQVQYDIYLIYNVDNKSNAQTKAPNIDNTIVYDYDDMKGLGYIPISKDLYPGSCHFPVLKFFLDNSGKYSYYWFIEYDVVFSASWSALMDYYSSSDADFIASHIYPFNEYRNWYWWSHCNKVGYPINECYRAFHPVCRYSCHALTYLDKYLKQGFYAHSELLIPTVLFHAGCKLLDMGGSSSFIEENGRNKFYISNETINTLRYKPSFSEKQVLESPYRAKLFHPVKSFLNIHLQHAIIIIAHRDFEQLIHLIEYFKHDCSVFIHIDKKAQITGQQLNRINNLTQVKAVRRKYSVHWGGFSVLKTELYMLRFAIENSDANYYHLISGQDYPIKPLNQFLEFFDQNNGREYIRLANIPNPKWDNYTYIRFKYYYPHDYIKSHNRGEAYSRINKIINIEKKIGIKRRVPDYFEMLYGSTQWFSITRKAVEALLNYTKNHKSFYRRTRWTFAPEEYYVATVVGNLMSKKCLSDTDLRFIRWQKENGNFPAHLGVEHFHCIANHNPFFFARKLDGEIGRELIALIDRYLLRDPECDISPSGVWKYNGFIKYQRENSLIDGISQLCHTLDIKSALDVGCGAGFDVAALRRRGIPATGLDANPYTTELSSLLLPKNDEPCCVADISKEIEFDNSFDLVYCIDMLNQLPDYLQRKALENITLLSGKFILIIETIGLYGTNNYSFKGFYINEACTKILSNNIKNPKYSIALFERIP